MKYSTRPELCYLSDNIQLTLRVKKLKRLITPELDDVSTISIETRMIREAPYATAKSDQNA